MVLSSGSNSRDCDLYFPQKTRRTLQMLQSRLTVGCCSSWIIFLLQSLFLLPESLWVRGSVHTQCHAMPRLNEQPGGECQLAETKSFKLGLYGEATLHADILSVCSFWPRVTAVRFSVFKGKCCTGNPLTNSSNTYTPTTFINVSINIYRAYVQP